MTQRKITESDAHQMLGDIKIQEICQQYFPGNKKFFLKNIKNIVDKILLMSRFGGLAEDDRAVSLVFSQEVGYCLEPRVKIKIRKIVKDISQLLAFGRG